MPQWQSDALQKISNDMLLWWAFRLLHRRHRRRFCLQLFLLRCHSWKFEYFRWTGMCAVCATSVPMPPKQTKDDDAMIQFNFEILWKTMERWICWTLCLCYAHSAHTQCGPQPENFPYCAISSLQFVYGRPLRMWFLWTFDHPLPIYLIVCFVPVAASCPVPSRPHNQHLHQSLIRIMIYGDGLRQLRIVSFYFTRTHVLETGSSDGVAGWCFE